MRPYFGRVGGIKGKTIFRRQDTTRKMLLMEKIGLHSASLFDLCEADSTPFSVKSEN